MFKVAIIGSRSINYELDSIVPKETECIISGGAKGVDSCAKQTALRLGLEYIEFLPDYKEYGKKAPLIRNNQIVEEADLVIAIWDGSSKGTIYTVNRAKKLGKPFRLLVRDIDLENAIRESIIGNEEIKELYESYMEIIPSDE